MDELLQLAKIGLGRIRHQTKPHIARLPHPPVVAVARSPAVEISFSLPGWPGEQIDRVFAPRIDQRRHAVSIQYVETATNQREALPGVIVHRRDEIQLAIKPRLD